MDLLKNPFYILTASPRDDRGRIKELADERSLQLNSDECMKAYLDLTNPRKRLSAEVAWLPGIGPKRAGELMLLLDSSSTDLRAVDKLTPMARANLLAAGLARSPHRNADDVAKWILAIAGVFEDFDPEALRVIINEERVVSGFQTVSDLSAVEAEIQERRKYYRQVIKLALDKLSQKDRVKAVTVAVESATDHGEKHGPILIADLVDSYEVEAQGFFDTEEGNLKALVEKVRAAVDAKQPDSILAPMVNQLIQVVKDWDTVAQPIQVSTKSRGLDHDASLRIFGLVRGLAVHMVNEHDKIDFSQQLTKMLQEVFAEVGKIAERTAEDANTLGEIAERRKLSRLLDPISDLCKAALENAEKHPAFADYEARKVMNAAAQLIANLSAANPGSEILSQGKDEIALTLMRCAIVYGNKTEKWKPCIAFLEEALKYASSQDVKSRIEKNLNTVRNNDWLYRNRTPMASAPSPNTTKELSLKWTLGIIGVMVVVVLMVVISAAITGGQDTRKSSPVTLSPTQDTRKASPATLSPTQNSRSTLGIEIDNAKVRAKQMEAQLDDMDAQRKNIRAPLDDMDAQLKNMDAQLADMDGRLNDYEGRMKAYRAAGNTDEYNKLVDLFNSLLEKRRDLAKQYNSLSARASDLFKEYSSLVDKRNNLYKEYSSLIDEINSKVRQYNATR